MSSMNIKKNNSLSSAPPLKTLAPQKNISQLENFALSALAPSMAVIFTLPFDTVKVRMQLQGEVKFMKDSAGKTVRVSADKVYKNSFDCLWKTFKYEGIRGLEKAPAWKRMFAGGICGALGAVSANPFELVKTRLQSSAAGEIAVGNQFKYTSVTSALGNIVRQEGGLQGLYRGSTISIYRGILGSAANLSSYTMLKDYSIREGYKDGVPLDIGCSLISALISVVFMNPLDVVRTRLYNAKSTTLSNESMMSSIANIVKNEGWRALYRGFGTHFMRIGPHFCLTFVFLEELKRGVKKVHHNEYQRKLQQYQREELFRSKADHLQV
ncbi:469_t:CDS:2 [Entrophospora sp. SA101]|nr:21249_t:CDS:2 [Entrophospora sp. SA101]CAJ0767996.1 469_t:CDS:2 [Entrophospora sp. SA101]CAJ0847054.1 3854_t:CDS:2 [Entrophospora sp. SA101]CAJ0907297.1 7197_t:CDS:2 [Entrophospora sp. SA101]CAJ0917790.1 1227_t:CDS:2 [Entrophospora sp. SA101]